MSTFKAPAFVAVATFENPPRILTAVTAYYAGEVRAEVGSMFHEDKAEGWKQAYRAGYRVRRCTVVLGRPARGR